MRSVSVSGCAPSATTPRGRGAAAPPAGSRNASRTTPAASWPRLRKEASTANATARDCAGAKRRTPVLRMPQSTPLASGSSVSSIASAVRRLTVRASTSRPAPLSTAATNSDHRMPIKSEHTPAGKAYTDARLPNAPYSSPARTSDTLRMPMPAAA